MQRIIAALLLIGIIFFAGCGDGAQKAKMENGIKVYKAYCQTCHMEEGGGVPRMNAALKGSVIVAGDKEKLVSIVLHGSEALAGDPARSYQNKMPMFANLTDEQIADVLTYIRNSFTNKGAGIAPADVSVVREKKN